VRGASAEPETAEKGAPPSTASAKRAALAGSRIPKSRERVTKLRERLSDASHPVVTGAEPKQTAAAVHELVDGLRARLETAARERSALADQLEEVRAALARAEAELKGEHRARAAVEAQAAERQRIAEEAVLEAEALAAERDQILAELTEHHRLDDEQATLLADAEAALARRDAENQSAVRDLADTRTLLDLRMADVADLEARVRAEAAAREGAEARCRALESEVARLSQAREALESIETMVTRRR
jgi:fused signal recognition particle receptor